MRVYLLMFYNQNSVLIAATLLALMLLSIWLGSLIGLRRMRRTSDSGRTQVMAVQGSLLGLLALLLGFTFSLSLARHDDRSRAVVAEANAIGTAWLRTDLIEEPARTELRRLMRAYVGARLASARLTMVEDADRAEMHAAAQAAFAQLWSIASATARDAGSPVTLSFVTALNAMFDAYGDRTAALERHVPELVLALLFVTLLFLSWVLGYASTVSGVRPTSPLIVMVFLIITLVFLIIDLDRPRRGFIAIDQSALLDLGADILATAATDSAAAPKPQPAGLP